MVSRVPTANQWQTLTNNILKTRDSLNKTSEQLTSGVKTQTFAEIPAQTGQLLGVQSLLATVNQYQNNINVLNTRLTLVDSSLSAIDSLANQFKTTLDELSNSTKPPDLQTQATSALDAFYQYANSQDATRYLFGGSQTTNQQPIKDLNATVSSTLTLSGAMEVTSASSVKVGATVTDAGGGTALITGVTTNAGGTRLSLTNITSTFTGTGPLSFTSSGSATAVANSYTTLDQATITLTGATTNNLKVGDALSDSNGGTAVASNVTTLTNGDIRVTLTKVTGGFGTVAGGTISDTTTAGNLVGAKSASVIQINNLIPVPTLANLSFTGVATGTFKVGDTIQDSLGQTATVSAVTTSANGTLARVYVQSAGGLSFGATVGGTIIDTTSGATTVATATPPKADDYVVKVAPATLSAAGLKVGNIVVQGANEAVVTGIDTTNGLLTLRQYTPSTGPQSGVFNTSLAVTSETGTSLLAAGAITDVIAPDATTGYYTNLQAAADATQSAKISDNFTMKYGIAGDNQAFEQIIRVLNYFKTTAVPASGTAASAAYQLEAQRGIATLQSAITNLEGIQATNAFNINQLTTQTTDNTSTVKIAKDTYDTILTPDQTELATQLQAIQTQLQSSYSVLGKLKDLSLVNYI